MYIGKSWAFKRVSAQDTIAIKSSDEKEEEEEGENDSMFHALPQNSGRVDIKSKIKELENKRRRAECQLIMVQSIFRFLNGRSVPHVEEKHLCFFQFSSILLAEKNGILLAYIICTGELSL
jgi:hypothetical protein